MSDAAATITARVEAVRGLMREEGLDGLLVRSADRFLNEYVPRAESTREWLTGFTGSMGEAFLTLDQAWVAVDGRYHLQADDETAGTPYAVEKVPFGTGVSSAVRELVKTAAAGGARRVGYEPDRLSARELEVLEEALAEASVELVPTLPSLPERARGAIDETRAPIRTVPDEAVGRSVGEKVALARPALEAAGVVAYVVQPLDALAYLTNLRGVDLPYQATFRGIGLLTLERVVLAVEPERVDPATREDRSGVLDLVGPGGWTGAIGAGDQVGYDPASTTAAVVSAIREAGGEPVSMPSPLDPMKARKTPAELGAMREAFVKADRVVAQAQAFVRARLDAGERVTEADLVEEVTRLFTASGAVGLSFKVIAAAGANGAHIHYSIPDPERVIQPQEMVLLDTGGYYAEGYATDLTRTFLAGSPELAPEATAEQRRVFTLVLKAAIAGMSARLPVGSRGDQLDALVRAPLWAAGLDFKHGTGHGVGINVHESPPRVSSKGGLVLEEGHVFSIEPGLYLEGFGGVRIENLCTVEPSPEHEGFLDVVPLTFSPLDHRLIDQALLEPSEKAWLEAYEARWEG
jgi:Xaa-Pro aminopeptidase